MTTPAVGSLAAILANITTLVTSALSWGSSVVTFISANPLIELFVITSFVGLGVGLVMRLIRG